MRLSVLCTLPILLLATACASMSERRPPMDHHEGAEAVEEVREERPLEEKLLLWIPNRVLDAFDMARAGVDIGPGLGADVQVLKGQGHTFHRTSVGFGLQTFRHRPVKTSSEVGSGSGPMPPHQIDGTPWHRTDSDIRLELHPLLVGGHVAIDVGEIWDAFLGLLLLDPSGDDL